MSLGTETLTPPMCAVRTKPPSSGMDLSAEPCFVAVSSVLTSPRLLNESSRRSSWLYWSLVTPIHTQVPSVMTVTTTDERTDDDDGAQRQHPHHRPQHGPQQLEHALFEIHRRYLARSARVECPALRRPV